jgi:hypothetical protein
MDDKGRDEVWPIGSAGCKLAVKIKNVGKECGCCTGSLSEVCKDRRRVVKQRITNINATHLFLRGKGKGSASRMAVWRLCSEAEVNGRPSQNRL